MKQNSSIKKLLAIVLAIACFLGTAGCFGQGDDPTLPPKTDGKRDPGAFDQEVSWDVMQSVTTDFPFDDYLEDEREKWYLGRDTELEWWFQFSYHQCEKAASEYDALEPVVYITGVDFTGKKPVGSDMEAVNLMMATGDFPDLITLDASHILVQTLIEGGYVYTMEELVDMYEPAFAQEVPDAVRTAGTDESGTWWGMVGLVAPEWKYSGEAPYDLGNHAYNVRNDIWEALGSPSIASPDDLYNTLKLFKQTYPELNGKESVGLVGYGDGADGTLLTLGYSFGLKQYISVDENNNVTSRYLDPNYEEFVLYLNKLYREGLMDPEFFVKSVNDQLETLANNGFMCPYVYHALNSANALRAEDDPNSVFVAIDPMSATGEEFSFAGTSRMAGESITLIPKTCSDPEAALRLIRYAYSETGSLQLLYGNPGEHYLVSDGMVSLTDKVKEGYSIDKNAYNKKNGIGDYYALVYMPLQEDTSDDDQYDTMNKTNSYPYSYDSTCERYNMQPSTTTDAGIAFTSVNSIGVRDTALAVTASTEEEALQIIRQMQAEIQKVPGFDELCAYWTEQYQWNMENLGGYMWGNP